MDTWVGEVYGGSAKPERDTEAPLLDRAHLARYTLGDAALEAEILDLFVGQAPQTIARLRQAATPQQWREAAHTLKGSARAVGSWRLAGAAEACERVRFEGDAPLVEQRLADVDAAFAEVRDFIAITWQAPARP
jgi:HPt (histidine-containing phosphotransfer) domain-containing protein